MPNSRLDKKKLEFYRKILLKAREDILRDIKNMSDDSQVKNESGDVAGHALHIADVATDMYDREFSLSLASNDRELLHKINAALRRIDDKTYGFCSNCHKPIPVARLKAIPYTETCLKCQEKIEQSL